MHPATLDEIRVQAALGRMEARDRLGPVFEGLLAALDDARHEVEKLAAEAGDPLEVREGVEASLQGLRREIEAAPELH
jgi:hypothetical protein